MKNCILLLLALALVTPEIVCAQVPTGVITGSVSDGTGARIAGATVTITNKDTGLKRTVVTSNIGDYTVSVLLPGAYEGVADVPGFKRLARETTVDAGNTATVNFSMQVGPSTDSVIVEGASPQIHQESHEVDGTITRPQIEGLPVNGRNFLELVKLEPGAQHQPERTTIEPWFPCWAPR